MMIEFKLVQPSKTILHLERSEIDGNTEFSLCRRLPDRNCEKSSLFITACSTPMLGKMSVIPQAGSGPELRLKCNSDSIDEASRELIKMSYMVENPANLDADFFMWYSLIMAGEQSGRTGRWHLMAMRVFPEYIECYYGDNDRYNVVRVEPLDQNLTVQVVDAQGKARDALRISYVSQRPYISMGTLQGYMVKRISSPDVPVYWNKLMIAQLRAQPNATYLVEDHRTMRHFCCDGGNDYIQKNLVGDEAGLVAYRF